MLSDFAGAIAVVTGGGTGIGRELVRRLAAQGAQVAACDVNDETLAETLSLAAADAPGGAKLTSHLCDVSDIDQVMAFRDAVLAEHDTDHINVLFSNAGIAGGSSFVIDDQREAWEKTFAVCWGGVYNCARAFMEALTKSDAGALVNTSSINGFWATVGPDTEHTAYCSAKFAVKGFTEALMTDLALHAPHISAHVVMPGHIGTSIVLNSTEIHGGIDVTMMRKRLAQRGVNPDALSDEELEQLAMARSTSFRDDAPTTATQAADIILDGVKAGHWRILVGDDALAIDEAVRADPENAYTEEFLEKLWATGHLGGLVPPSDG